MQRIFGWAENGNVLVQTSGLNSSKPFQGSFPGATVTVFISGSNNTANLFSDNTGTPLANPFTASNSGYWDFYAASGRYTVQFSGNNIASPFSLPDILVGALQSINGQSGENINIVVGTAGNNFNITANNNNVALNLPQANANNNGFLAASDWANFNAAAPAYTFIAPLNNNAGNVSITLPLTVAQGGSNANNKTQAFDNLSPQANKGDLIVFDGNNAVPLAVGANNNLVLLVDSSNNNGVKWGAVPVGNANGILPIANGGTNGNNATQAFDNLAPVTTKGDLIVGNNNAIAVRLPVGGNNTSLIADSANTSGVKWAQVDLSAGVTGVLPIANGGTGNNNATSAFALLSPITNQGDLIQGNATGIPVRTAIGSNNTVLTANNNNAVWQTPTYQVSKFTVAFNNNAFTTAGNNTTVTLFTLGQFQKVAGVTVKPSVLFLNANNTITDVTISTGVGGNANLFSHNYSVGNNGAVGNSNFQDSAGFASVNMGAGQAVLATFLAANNNFGNGSATVLTGGSVDIWMVICTLQ